MTKLKILFLLTLPALLSLLLGESPAFAGNFHQGPPESMLARFLASKTMAFVAALIALVGIGCFVTGGGRTEADSRRLGIGLICLIIAGAMFFYRFHLWRASYTGYY